MSSSHIFWPVGGQHLYMLGGNQSNRVSIARYPLSVWDTLVVPADFDESAATLPVYAGAASQAGAEA